MSYKAEQIQYRKELEEVNRDFNKLEKLLEENPQLKVKKFSIIDIPDDFEERRYRKILENQYHDLQTFNDSKYMLLYKIPRHRKWELENNLRFENGNGCATFCFWFVIIEVIFVFLYIMASK